jgi:predicted dithiol-disulfide oxidoreductase (DUF899 family)
LTPGRRLLRRPGGVVGWAAVVGSAMRRAGGGLAAKLMFADRDRRRALRSGCPTLIAAMAGSVVIVETGIGAAAAVARRMAKASLAPGPGVSERWWSSQVAISAQTNPASSRATAVTTTLRLVLWASRRRNCPSGAAGRSMLGRSRGGRCRDGIVYHTYSAYARGIDAMWGMYPWLDRAPKGRNETDRWYRLHDEYDEA